VKFDYSCPERGLVAVASLNEKESKGKLNEYRYKEHTVVATWFPNGQEEGDLKPYLQVHGFANRRMTSPDKRKTTYMVCHVPQEEQVDVGKQLREQLPEGKHGATKISFDK
jgi:hypothetical protein